MDGKGILCNLLSWHVSHNKDVSTELQSQMCFNLNQKICPSLWWSVWISIEVSVLEWKVENTDGVLRKQSVENIVVQKNNICS